MDFQFYFTKVSLCSFLVTVSFIRRPSRHLDTSGDAGLQINPLLLYNLTASTSLNLTNL